MSANRASWDAFWKGAFAGFVSLGFMFILRLGNIAPYPPESSLEAFLRVIPESIQEPSVQTLGDFAGEIGLVVATIIAVFVYGAFGLIFEKYYAPRMITKSLSRYEKFLVYSIFPWLFFGFIVLPLSGVSVFGVGSPLGSSTSTNLWLYPLGLLLGTVIFSVVLAWEYKGVELFAQKKSKAAISQRAVANVRESPSASRRSFVEKGAIALAALALMATSIDSILTSSSSSSTPSQPTGTGSGTPVDLNDAPSIFKDPRLASLVDAEITQNDDFYRVSIDIFDPSVNASTWSLQVAGMVNNPKTYSLAQLQALPKSVEYNTFECVSNTINGNLISNAKWGGVKLSDLFSDTGGVQQGAQYVVFYSVDGYSVGIPVQKALMSDSIAAYEMNDVPLPQRHGYPLRAVIPGLYGMMSAKWVRKIQIINTSYMGYWQTRGWSNVGTVQTVAFIVVPGDGEQRSLSQNNGTILLGGYAFAGDRGISKVEVSTDGGNTWQTAELKKPLANNTWTLWAYAWQPSATGQFPIYARATDGSGTTQTSNSTDTFPNGATGYAMSVVNIAK